VDGTGIEVGQARDDELDAVLRLMCISFEMPYRAARPIYYADPYLDSANKRVVRLHGQIVSCLSLVPAQCWIGPSVLPIVGLAGVATHPDHQGQGYAGLLLRDTLRSLQSRECVLSALLAVAPDLYLRHGWQLAGSEAHLILPRTALLASPSSSQPPMPLRGSLSHENESRFRAPHPPLFGGQGGAQPPGRLLSNHVRSATADDLPGLARCYEREATGRALHCLRDGPRWHYLLSQPHSATVYAPGDSVEAYMIHEIRHGRVSLHDGGYPPTLVVKELRASGPAARQALLHHLAAQERIDQVEFVARQADLRAHGLLVYGGRIETSFQTLVRIVDFRRLLLALCPFWSPFKGRIGLILADTTLPELSQQMIITSDGAAVEVVGGDADAENDRVIGAVGPWSRVVVGQLSGEDACAFDLLRPSSAHARTLISEWFPFRDPYLPAVDHF